MRRAGAERHHGWQELASSPAPPASGRQPAIRVRGGASAAADQMFGGVRLALFGNAASARAAAWSAGGR
eukprot:scaffold9680_cov114-Isochrysis_galbana.AAC.1